jgi:hypothetical protein
MKIELHIEELVLDGFDPRDRYRIADELQRALTHALSEPHENNIEPRAREVDRLDAGSVTLQKNASARHVGTQVAGAIVDALNGSTR